jgi:hypothetical protein
MTTPNTQPEQGVRHIWDGSDDSRCRCCGAKDWMNVSGCTPCVPVIFEDDEAMVLVARLRRRGYTALEIALAVLDLGNKPVAPEIAAESVEQPMSDDPTTSELAGRLQKMADMPGMNAVNHTGRATLHLAADRLEVLRARVDALEETLGHLHENMNSIRLSDKTGEYAHGERRHSDHKEIALSKRWMSPRELAQVSQTLIAKQLREETR